MQTKKHHKAKAVKRSEDVEAAFAIFKEVLAGPEPIDETRRQLIDLAGGSKASARQSSPARFWAARQREAMSPTRFCLEPSARAGRAVHRAFRRLEETCRSLADLEEAFAENVKRAERDRLDARQARTRSALISARAAATSFVQDCPRPERRMSALSGKLYVPKRSPAASL